MKQTGSFMSLSAIGAYLSLHRPRIFLPLFIIIFVIATGFMIAHFRTWVVQAPILQKEIGPTWVRGELQKIEKKGTGHRIVLDEVEIWKFPQKKTPKKVRLNIRTSMSGSKIGDFISVRAKLSPPPGPVFPGSYDFARRAYFEQIGAVGYSLSDVEIKQRAEARGTPLNHFFDRLRVSIGERISNVFGAEVITDQEGIALALLTGDKGLIKKDILETMRKTGLGHLLAISGLHLVLVTASIFFIFRAILSLIPVVSLRYNIKKWAAIAAMVAGLFYLLITGNPVSAQRAFIMVSIFLLAILIDRVGSPMRPAIWAALIILLFTPEAIMGPSFQMSFAASIALIAAFQAVPWSNLRNQGMGIKGRKTFLIYLFGTIFSSIVAGIATAPFSIYHFGNFAPYSILANMVAIPITTFIVMPAGLLSLLLMPFGLDTVGFKIMELGIDGIIFWAKFIHALPQSSINLPTISPPSLALITFGGLWLCFWRKGIRKLGLVPLVLGIFLIFFSKTEPDIIIDRNAKLFAVKSVEGDYIFSSRRYARFSRAIWTQKLGQSKNVLTLDDLAKEKYYDDTTINVKCNNKFCRYGVGGKKALIIKADQGDKVATDDVVDYCREVDILVNLSGDDNACKTAPDIVFISKDSLLEKGTHLIWLLPEEVLIETVEESRGQRPWTNTR